MNAPDTSSARLVTRQMLVEHLLATQVVTAADVISLLGDQRKVETVNVLELALVRGNVVSKGDLLSRKAVLSGGRAFPDGRTEVSGRLPAPVAAQSGSLLLERDPLTVAMIEPTDANKAVVAAALGTDDFEVWVTTAAHFSEYYQATYHGGTITLARQPVDLAQTLDMMIERRASDLHLKTGLPPKVRVDGSMVSLPFDRLDQQWMRRAVEAIAPARNQEEIAAKFSSDFAYTFGSARFRVNVAHDSDGYTMVLRRLPTQVPTADELALPPVLRGFAGLERGLVLVTGPTGSGKSTTLAAILNILISESSRHVITLEDPIEFRFPTDRPSLVNQRELGTSFASFPGGIRDALRQDPDVMLVGEMRDRETTRAALELADTGHLVFATLHTIDAPTTVQRVVSQFPADEQDSVRVQLAHLLKGCVSQTLLPRATGKGRVAAFEILVATPAIGANLRKVDGANHLKQTMQTAVRDGMCTMEQSLAHLVHKGVVTKAEAEFRAQSLTDFHAQLTHLAQGR